MRISLTARLLAAALMSGAAAAPALAQDSEPESESAFTVTGGATLVSD